MKETNKNLLTVIILNYNDADSAIKYVNAIKKYTLINHIIIADNYSTDDSFIKLKKLQSKLIDVISTDKNGGYAYGNNYAINYAIDKYGKPDFICISNPDVEVSEDAYKKCLNYLLKHDSVAICAPRMFDINHNPHQLSGWKERTLKGDIHDSSSFITKRLNKPHIERYDETYLNNKVAKVDCVAGSFFIIRQEAFEKVGYFDSETFLYFEEDILGKKLKNLGYINVVLNTCNFTHFESVTIDKNMKYIKKYKNLQKSKHYYHCHYNDRCNKWYNNWKLLILDIITILEIISISIKNTKLYFYFSKLKEKIHRHGKRKCFLYGLLTMLTYIFLPLILLCRFFHIKKRVLYFSLVTWKWIKQRPHFVALGLSDNYKVTYTYQTLKSKYMPIEQTKFEVKNELKNKALKIKPFDILPMIPSFNKKNTYRNFLRTSLYNYDKIIFTQPNQIDFFFMNLLKIKKIDIYYECMDNYIGWEQDRISYENRERTLINYSKHIFVSSEKLKENLINKYNTDKNKICVVRNGYDRELFANPKKVDTKLKQPNLTYIGTIDEWFDFDTICDFASKHPEINIDIIGPSGATIKTNINNIKNKNIIFHGSIEHDSVPSYINDSTVMIMPFRINEIIEYVDPVKLYEYLYLKKPVVCSYWSELEQFRGMVSFYKNKNDFEKKVMSVINNDFRITKEYKKLIKESTWNERLKNYLRVLRRK